MAKRKTAPKKKPAPTPERDEYGSADHVVMTPTKCKRCGSTDRTAYSNVRKPLVHAGKETIWRRTRCKKCGQSRIDVEHRQLD